MAETKKSVKSMPEELPILVVEDDNKDVPEEVIEESTEQTPEAAESTAKAGKRSAKALKATEEKLIKTARKEKSDSTEKPAAKSTKQTTKPPRSKLERRGKKFRKIADLIDVTKTYDLAEAVDLAIKTNPTKFDATVELHIRLNIDPRHSDQNIRDTIVLPAGTGKKVRVAVFADAEGAKVAREAGADIAGLEEITKLIEKNQLNFDVLIAPPTLMPQLGKFAKVLGPRGLMPNPKSGTVAVDVVKAVTEAKAGKVEYRADSAGIVHVGIGKVSFGNAKILQNAEALLASIKGNKPASVKTAFIKSIFMATSMGPSIAVNQNTPASE